MTGANVLSRQKQLGVNCNKLKIEGVKRNYP